MISPDPMLLVRAEEAIQRAEITLEFMQNFLGILTIVLVVAGAVFGLFGVRNVRRVAELRRDAEETEQAIQRIKKGLETSWLDFERLQTDLRTPQMYLTYEELPIEQEALLEDLDRIVTIADALNIPQDREKTGNQLVELSRQWKAKGRFSRAVRRCERASEIADQLGVETTSRRDLRIRAHLYLAMALTEWAAESESDSGKPATAALADRWLDRAERELGRAKQANGGVATTTILTQLGYLAATRGDHGTAVGEYLLAFERGRDSRDPREVADAYIALFNSACSHCKQAERAGAEHLDKALANLRLLPRSEPWRGYIRREPDLEPLRRSPAHSNDIAALGGGHDSLDRANVSAS